ncbi:MAG: hypothetical protein DRO98_08680 [Archaeoglobales archaeon]|nr:MAG: hypothetical protein DRO98_08680 [Archaeoglobales archaeon]
MSKFVSIVVPTCNRPEMLKECLESYLTKAILKDKYEIIVVDSSSEIDSKTIEVLKNKSPSRFVYLH